jgi:hypothetical protein
MIMTRLLAKWKNLDPRLLCSLMRSGAAAIGANGLTGNRSWLTSVAR